MAQPGYFDTLYPDHITGTIEEPVVKDLDGTPNLVLELGRPWSVEIKWRLESDLTTTHPVTGIDGTWHVQISLESLGKGFEDVVAEGDVPFYPATPQTTAKCGWSKVFSIPNKPPDEAVYKLVTLITFKNTSGNRMPMAGFGEHPLISFYKPT